MKAHFSLRGWWRTS
ncbi:trp operon leader peptide [Enterobacteriaceae bacterium RIT714]|nr:trp operon leader peptide [Enterobacteriaceae bacterium RIT714]